MKVQLEELENRYEKMTSSLVCSCSFATQLAGGQPASPEGVRAFVSHHLKLTSTEADEAVARILAEEIGAKPVPAPEGELDERLTYGINVIRRTEHGPFLGNWMVHACLKQAASRLKIFQEFRGSKGNFAEAGRVSAVGDSLVEPDRPDRIYLIAPDGGPAPTHFEEFKGRVQSPRGSVSVVHHSEVAPPRTRFEFEFRFLNGDLKDDDIKDFLALSMIVGLGSVKSLGCGKFLIESAEINRVTATSRKPKAAEAAA